LKEGLRSGWILVAWRAFSLLDGEKVEGEEMGKI